MLGAPLPWERVHVIAPPLRALAQPCCRRRERVPRVERTYALVVSRLAPEKGVDVAIDACRMAGIALVIAGDGPERAALQQRTRRRQAAAPRCIASSGASTTPELARLRAGASIALVPSRSAETFGLAAAEAMAAGLPVVASRVGALAELLDERALVPAGRRRRARAAIGRLAGDREQGARDRERVRAAVRAGGAWPARWRACTTARISCGACLASERR